MKITSVFLCLLVLSCATAKKSAVALISNNEENVNLITTDIENFWKAYDLCKGAFITLQEKIFDSIYIKNASKCLKEIILARKLTGSDFVKWLNSESDYFSKCKSTSKKIKKYEIEIRDYLKKFKAIYPAATYADIYFMFTGFYTGGQSKKSGIAIGMDFWSFPDSVPVNFNNPLFKELVRKIDVMPVTIIHELVHKNQPDKNATNLLGKCLKEGGADFIAYLLTNKISNPNMYSFANAHENDLWLRFKKDMATNNTDYWLYNKYDSNRPRDLGYSMGFKICENYYNISADKSKAVYNIMNITDPDAFLTMSKYNFKFN
jgi:hypothetical protein